MWRSRSKLKIIQLAPILAILALMSWALASPVGSSPDDDYHLASIWCAAGDNANECRTVGDETKRAVPEALTRSACFRYKPEQSAACQGKNFDAGQSGLVTTSRGNFSGSYPPLYYLTMNLFVISKIDVSVVLMRIVNILLVVGLFTVLYMLLPVNRRLSLVWGLAISVVPLGLFVVASNNPSAWAIISAGTLWISLVGYFESSGAKKAGLGAIAALSTVLGAGARADAAVYAVIAIGAVVLLTARLNRRWIMSALLPFALAVTAAVLFFTTRQSSIGLSGMPIGSGAPSQALSWRDLFLANSLNVPSLWVGVFGTWGLGWLDTAVPAVVWVGSLGCFAALAFAGLVSHSTRKLLALTMTLGALWLIPTYVSVQSGVIGGPQVQPRYILPLMILFGGIALFHVGGESLRLSKLQVVALVSTLSVANALALHFNMRRYTTGVGGKSRNPNTANEWWWSIPVSPASVWVVGSLSFAAFLMIIAMGTLFTRPQDQGFEHGAIVPVRSGARLDFVAQDEVVAGATGLGKGQVRTKLRDGGGGPPGRQWVKLAWWARNGQ